LLILAGIGVASGSDSVHQADVISRAMQGIITGIGFLGAGVILRDTSGTQVHGITTAATIWLTATLGVLCGAGMWPVALLGVALTLVILVLGKPLEKFVHRKFPKLSEHNRDDVPPRT
jgi:putative Mg2+ transporter-C (MgtC) family protein